MTNDVWRRRVLVVALLIPLGGCNDAAVESPPEPIAEVRAVPVREGELSATIAAYGTVVAAPGSARTIRVPFACRVRGSRVVEGEMVAPGDTLIVIEPSPDARLEIERADAGLAAARQRLEAGRERMELGLATHDEIAQLEQELADARALYGSVESWTQGLSLTAEASGIVDQVAVSTGELVPAGGALVSMVDSERLVVRLDVEPEDADLVAPGQPVIVTTTGRAATTVPAVVISVGRKVDRDTRLVPVLVDPADGGAVLLLGDFVHGEITVRTTRGVIVPRSALLPEQDRMMLFTVKGGRAARHVVDLGLEANDLVAVRDTTLAAGDSVVVLGSYELSDGMRIRVAGVPDDSTAGTARR